MGGIAAGGALRASQAGPHTSCDARLVFGITAGAADQSGGSALRASTDPITTSTSPAASTWDAGGFTSN
jgi:hypothetical protein